MCNNAEDEHSSTVIRRCGASFGSFRSLGGKNVTFFGVTDNENDGDDDNDNNKRCNLRRQKCD